jgi:DNA repair exonuclease SbcCD ATPase subunit
MVEQSITADITIGDMMEEGSDYLTEEQKDIMEQKKEYLNSYKNLCRKLQSLEEQLQSLREVEQSAKIQELSDMPRGGRQKDLSDYIVRLDKILSKVIRTKQECIDRKLEIEDQIADMQDGIESAILHKRYIEFKPWEQICVELNYSWKHTHRIHSKALNSFEHDIE